jgi:excisionase family DNA binding protein
MRKNKLNEEVYSVEEVAKRLKVNVRVVRRLIDKGELTAFKVGREYRIRASALENFVKQRETRDTPNP